MKRSSKAGERANKAEGKEEREKSINQMTVENKQGRKGRRQKGKNREWKRNRIRNGTKRNKRIVEELRKCSVLSFLEVIRENAEDKTKQKRKRE